jgi:hypothetical protein
MKIILSESQIHNLIDEALRDEIPPYMSDIVQKRYQNVPDILDRDIPQHTDKIPNIKTEISNPNIGNRIKNDLAVSFELNIMAQFRITKLYQTISNHGELVSLINNSLGIESIFAKSDEEGSFYGMMQLYSKNFKLPTPQSNSWSNPSWSNNKSGIATFLKICKKTFPSLNDLDVESIITDRRFVGLREPIINSKTIIDNIMDNPKLFLYITDKPDDKLRMSISAIYDSCQNLYSGGEEGTQWNKKLLSNVFDVNSKVAYLIYDSPYTDNKGNRHPFTSVARTIIRVNEKGGIMFDKVYPTYLEDEFYQVIEEKTGLKNTGNRGDVYHYHGIEGIPSPYMDKFALKNTNVNQQLLDNPRVQALSQVVDVTNVEEVSEQTFIVDGERWEVNTYDEAMEHTRDFLYDNFDDVHHDTPIKKLIYGEIFGREGEAIFDLLDITEEEFEETGFEFSKEGLIEYLEEMMGIVKFSDIWKIPNATTGWMYRNIDMGNYIDYIGGDFEAMQYALAHQDGIIHENNGYYIYTLGTY